jgi:putative membrane protein
MTVLATSYAPGTGAVGRARVFEPGTRCPHPYIFIVFGVAPAPHRAPNMRLLLRLLINAAALWVATRYISGLTYTGSPAGLLGVALVFGVINVTIRPILKLFSLPFIILTLGLFTLIINALMLLLTSAVSRSLDLGFTVSGFKAAFWGALCVSIVSIVLSMLLVDKREKAR